MKQIKKLLGHVGVDSGQLMITDPCYIDSQWEKKDFKDIRLYKHIKSRRVYHYNSPFSPIKNLPGKSFVSYDEIINKGKSMNDMIQAKEVKQIKTKEQIALLHTFSYAGICESSEAKAHQINYKAGHPGVAVTFNSGYGDGYYPVYGTFNKEERCVKVEIDCNMTKVQAQFFTATYGKPKKRTKKGSK